MGNFFNFLMNNIQLLFFVAVAVLPAIGAVVRWAEKQREERRRMAEVERRRLEALRTGRVEVSTSLSPQRVPPAATSRQQEAARRQREMQERLRQRLEQQRQRQAQAGTAPSRRPAPTAPTSPRTAPPRQRPAPVARRTAPPAAGGGRRVTVERRRSRPAPQVVPAQTLTETPTLVARQEIGAPNEGGKTAAPSTIVPRVGPGMSVERLREAIVLRELLDRPLALRESGSDLFD